ncbi:MAG: DUF58 domain-containing protein [Anaerolineales bacterium]
MWFRTIFHRRDKADLIEDLRRELPPADLSFPPSAWRQLDRLRLRASRHIRGRGAGQRPSARRRPAVDFRQHRKYVPGDDVRFVDWKASARHEHIFLKQGEQPQEVAVYLLIDTTTSMAWGRPPKRDTALRLAATLGYLALANDDRLHIVPLSEQVRTLPKHLGPLKGKGQFPSLLNYLRDIPFDTPPSDSPTGITQPIRDFNRRVARGGVVIILSDLLDAHDLSKTLAVFPPPAWEVTVLHLLHPRELAPEINGEFEMIDAETGRSVNYDITPKALDEYREHLQTWRDAVEMTCIEHKAFYTLISTGWSLEKEIVPHLRSVRVLELV